MTAVADSGPFIHLAIVGRFDLLKRYFHKLVIIPQVYDEVVTLLSAYVVPHYHRQINPT